MPTSLFPILLATHVILAVSLFLPEVPPATTWDRDARQTADISGGGDFTAAERFERV